jgi:hypothetical protein
MPRVLARLLLLVAIVCAEVIVAHPVAQARSADPCPEPNDTFQAACYLGTASDALGFISKADDIDAYRFEALDFGVKARLELADAPGQYRLHLADWNGKVIAESSDQGGAPALEHTLGPPGSYYVFVDSKTGEASDTAPYRLTTNLAYVGAVPQAAYANEFRSGQTGLCTVDYVAPGFAECEAKDGKFIAFFPGVRTSPVQRMMFGAWGPELADFTVVTDTRLVGDPARHTIYMVFRATTYCSEMVPPRPVCGGDGQIYNLDGYRLGLKLDAASLSLRSWASREHGAPKDLLPYDGFPIGDMVSLNVDGVNRVVVRGAGPDFIVNINGVEVVRLQDDRSPAGQFAFGVGAYGKVPHPTTYFDNALVTVP